MLPLFCPSRRAAFALAFSLLWGLASGSALAQSSDDQTALTPLVAEERQDFQAWQLACFSQPNADHKQAGCTISTRFDLLNQAEASEARNTLLVFTVTYSPAAAGPIGVFSLPLGVYLPTGLALVFGGSQSLRLPFETCNQTGCHAGLLLKSEVQDLLAEGQSVEVMFQNERQQTIKLPLSLQGYAAAAEALAERQTAS